MGSMLSMIQYTVREEGIAGGGRMWGTTIVTKKRHAFISAELAAWVPIWIKDYGMEEKPPPVREIWKTGTNTEGGRGVKFAHSRTMNSRS